ncbi:MAG: class I SAM-dependent methyltransferase [Proteobacteria bacterium]|nr:class I SAM-dependent methyltransferase [Pseudomonadota bacterium]
MYQIGKCSNCGLIQIFPLPSEDDLKALYEENYNFGGESGTVYSRLRDHFLSSSAYLLWLFLDGDVSFHSYFGSGSLLDVGCNEGRSLLIYKKHGFRPEGLELNEKAAAVATAKGFKIHTELIEDFYPEEKYDLVVLANVLEHSTRPTEMIRHVARILNPGGQVWISCPNVESWQRKLFGRYWINWHVPFHIAHYSNKTLNILLMDEGFHIEDIRQESPSAWMTQSLIARFYAKRGKPTKKLRNPLLVGSMMLFIRLFCFPILWFGNHFGIGDCLVVKAKKDF